MSNNNPQAAFHELRQAVTKEKDAAERQLRAAIKTMRQQLADTERVLDSDEFPVLNQVGELQSTLSKFESAVGALARLSEVSRVAKALMLELGD